MNYVPLHVYSYYSILRGLNSPKEIAQYAKKLGMEACALTDINNISGCIEFYKACKDNKIKPIIGSVISTPEGSLIIIAKNRAGYDSLVQIIAILNSKIEPNITLDELATFDLTNIFCITGHEDSSLYNCIAKDFKLKENGKQQALEYLKKILPMFPVVCIELQYSEYDTFSKDIKKIYSELAIENAIPLVMCPRVYYLEEQDKELHKILISVDEGKSLDELNQINNPMYKFFDGYLFHMPSYEEIKDKFLKSLPTTIHIANFVEDYQLQQSPQLPKFKTKQNKTSEQTFTEEVQKGWDKKIKNIVPNEQHDIYRNRIKKETQTFIETNLCDYFLIIQDILNYARSKGYLIGPGRGSVGGCLTAYLMDIHEMDSIKYNLLFERFYNKGRSSSLPDIDTDFEKRARTDIIKYITKKYGKDNVMHIATYSTLMGRAALKAVFRAYGDISFAEQNEITKNIVDKAKISDELQLMKDAGEEPSVILWCLKNRKDNLSNWCIISEDGKLEGPLAKRFEQAIRLEGVIATQSVHAAGICISPQPLKKLVPIVFNSKEKTQIIACQMNELEYIGLIKMDILGLSTLDRLKDINDI